MKNTYLLVVTDPDEPTYGGTYVMQHDTRSEFDLRRDYEVVLNLHMQGDEDAGWSLGDVMRSLQKLGWKILDIPEVKVSY